MGDKRGNLKLISGLLLSSFILNYILIRVKERGFGINKIERTRERERRESIERETIEKGKNTKLWENLLA